MAKRCRQNIFSLRSRDVYSSPGGIEVFSIVQRFLAHIMGDHEFNVTNFDIFWKFTIIPLKSLKLFRRIVACESEDWVTHVVAFL